MTNEEIVAKIQAGENVADNLEKLFFNNEGLWVYAIKPFAAYGDFEELKQEAFLAVAEAAKLYKPERGAFSSFAVMKIRQELPVYLSSYNGFSIPEWWITVQGKYADLVRDGVTDEKELSARLGVSVENVERLRRSVVSGNSPAFEEEEIELLDTIAAPEDTEAEALERIGAEELRREVWEEVEKCIKGKKLEIIKALFVEGVSMIAVSRRFGCSRQYISFVKMWALRRLEKSEKLRELANDYDYISKFFFRGSVNSFKYTGCSAVEKYILEKEKLDKRRMRIITQYYQEEEINSKYMGFMSKGGI